MFKRKHKNPVTHNTLLIGGVVVFVLVFMSVMLLTSNTKVEAVAARCSNAQLGGGIGSCFKSDGTPNYPVANDPGGPKADHCYEVRYSNTFGWLYFDVGSCDQLPFNQDSQTVRCADGSNQTGTTDQTAAEICANNGGVSQSSGSGGGEKVEIDCKDPNVDASNCGIIRYILQFTNALSALVGVVVVIMIVVAGIQYSSSRDNPQAVAAARGKIVNAIMALVFYLFIYAFLQWVIPGGLF